MAVCKSSTSTQHMLSRFDNRLRGLRAITRIHQRQLDGTGCWSCRRHTRLCSCCMAKLQLQRALRGVLDHLHGTMQRRLLSNGIRRSAVRRSTAPSYHHCELTCASDMMRWSRRGVFSRAQGAFWSARWRSPGSKQFPRRRSQYSKLFVHTCILCTPAEVHEFKLQST